MGQQNLCGFSAKALLAMSRDVMVLLVVRVYAVGIAYRLLQCFQRLGPCQATKHSFVPDSSFGMSLGDPCVVPLGWGIGVYFEPLHEFPIKLQQSAHVDIVGKASVQT